MGPTHPFVTPAPQPALPERIPATFTGKAADYARVHYTNVFLSIITLGVYSSWAKVRNRRYFYGNTSFLDASFDFDARPLTILISRIIVIGFFLALSHIEALWELTLGVYGFSFLTFILLLPILLVRGRSFGLRHSLWRGVRFSYAKRFGPSYAHLFCFSLPQLATFGLLAYFYLDETTAFLFEQEKLADWWVFKLFILLMCHLVLLWPIGFWWRHRIRVNQMSFGKLEFQFTATARSYVFAYLKHFLPIAVLLGLLAFSLLATAEFLFLLLLTIPFLYMLAISYVAHTALLFWNNIVTTEGSKIEARFSPTMYAFWITVPNHVLNILSLGLLLPVTRIRRWRYLANRITFLPSAALREAAARADDVESAVASEALDIEGFDLDLGMI